MHTFLPSSILGGPHSAHARSRKTSAMARRPEGDFCTSRVGHAARGLDDWLPDSRDLLRACNTGFRGCVQGPRKGLSAWPLAPHCLAASHLDGLSPQIFAWLILCRCASRSSEPARDNQRAPGWAYQRLTRAVPRTCNDLGECRCRRYIYVLRFLLCQVPAVALRGQLLVAAELMVRGLLLEADVDVAVDVSRNFRDEGACDESKTAG